jgi:hypothetical protein
MHKNVYFFVNISKLYVNNLRKMLSHFFIINKKLILFLFISVIIFICLHFYETRFSYFNKLQSMCSCKNDSIILTKYLDRYYVKLKKDSYELNDNFNITCDLYNVLKRGKSQKVLAYSLYGRNEFYYKKLTDIVKIAKHVYPNWIIRIYYDNSINKSIICDIECMKNENELFYDNVDFCNIEILNLNLNGSVLNASYIHSMKWRWFPLGDSLVDIFSSRDIDSFILSREIDAVDEWISSNRVGHIMRGKLI